MNKAALLKRGLYLEYITLGWNVVGVGIVLIAAWRAGSVALAGFGLDSLIEIFASLVVVWELNDIAHERRRHALRMIGIAFLLLAWGKKVTGDALSNPVLKTEGRVTLVDALLAGAVLVGLVLNALFGLWWADPLAGLVIVYYGFKEGWHALHA